MALQTNELWQCLQAGQGLPGMVHGALPEVAATRLRYLTCATEGTEASLMSNGAGGSHRRQFLRTGLVLGLGAAAGRLLDPRPLLAAVTDPDPEVPNEQVAKILKDLFGDRPIRKGQVQLDMPAVAEDGRVVPVLIEAPDLPMQPDNYVKAVHLIVDHNPDPHLAAFDLTPAIGRPSLQFRIKMKRTTWVRAIMETSTGDVWADYARVTVSLNGCG